MDGDAVMSIRLIKQNTLHNDIDAVRKGRRLICDFDGVLVETGLAVINAYRKAGARNPWLSQNMHWTEWCSPEVHEKKNEIFIQTCATECRVLPLYEYALKNNGVILSSCSQKAFNALKDAFKIELPVLGIGLTKDEKFSELMRQDAQESFFYMDDSLAFCKRVSTQFGPDSVAGVMKTSSFPMK